MSYSYQHWTLLFFFLMLVSLPEVLFFLVLFFLVPRSLGPGCGMQSCWRRPSRGHDHQLTCEQALTQAGGAPHPLLYLWNVHSSCIPCLQELLQGHSLDIVMWGWDHLDSTDWVQVRLIYKLLIYGRQEQRYTHLVAAKDKHCM